jgi:aliphatic nitrilase
MGDSLGRIRVAAVQAASVHLDREASVAKACDLIAEAGRRGAQLIAFPEGFIPAHPCWFTVRPATGATALSLAKRLFAHSVTIPGPETEVLGEACRSAGLTAVIGVCEKRPGSSGTMFNTQIVIGPDGRLLGKHRKLTPTLAERIVHAPGYGDTLKVFEAPFGRLSCLICGENGSPLAIAALLAHYPLVHVASWPAFVSPATRLSDVIDRATQGLAHMMGVFVVNASGVLDDRAIEDFGATGAELEFLRSARHQGFASVIGPKGQKLTQPVTGEALVCADIDLDDVIIPKIVVDHAGHYGRPDVFDLRVLEPPPGYER